MEVPASLLIWGLSCKTTFNKELWTSSFPLYSMKPNSGILFMKKLTRDRVVPIISASVRENWDGARAREEIKLNAYWTAVAAIGVEYTTIGTVNNLVSSTVIPTVTPSPVQRDYLNRAPGSGAALSTQRGMAIPQPGIDRLRHANNFQSDRELDRGERQQHRPPVTNQCRDRPWSGLDPEQDAQAQRHPFL